MDVIKPGTPEIDHDAVSRCLRESYALACGVEHALWVRLAKLAEPAPSDAQLRRGADEQAESILRLLVAVQAARRGY